MAAIPHRGIAAPPTCPWAAVRLDPDGGACGGGGGIGRLAVLTSFMEGTLAMGLVLTGFGGVFFAAISFSGFAGVFLAAGAADRDGFFAVNFGFSIGCSGGGSSRSGPLSPPPDVFCIRS